MKLRWVDWIYVVGIALNIISGVVNLATPGQVAYGISCLTLAFFIALFMQADRERERLRNQRTVTHNIEVHQQPGELPEVFARRLADELSQSTRWMR